MTNDPEYIHGVLTQTSGNQLEQAGFTIELYPDADARQKSIIERIEDLGDEPIKGPENALTSQLAELLGIGTLGTYTVSLFTAQRGPGGAYTTGGVE